VKAALYDRYGPPEVLSVREVPDPVPARGQLLVRVRAAALNPKDVLVRKGKFRAVTGGRFPQRTGYDWAGELVSAPGRSGRAAGQRLFGMVQSWKAGACAELLAAREDECAPMPEGLAFEEAAALPLASLTALQALRDVARARAGGTLLVNGASGGVGTLAVQLGKALGLRVTAVTSARNAELVRSLGADDVVDYAVSDPLGARAAYDTVFDVYGNRSFTEARASLRHGGMYVTTVPSRQIVLDSLRTLVGPARARLVVVRSRRKDLLEVGRLVAGGKLRPVVDRVLPLGEIAAGHAHLETRRARGKVVLAV
jgi:NADPH:quinone reductase-like Zn-dependent oxidoreductase